MRLGMHIYKYICTHIHSHVHIHPYTDIYVYTSHSTNNKYTT